MTAPVVKGWCPGALRPMQSGDGFIVRVRPFRAELTCEQALALCDISEAFGNGVLDLTSRANLQIRGVQEVFHPEIMSALADLNLLDHSEKSERHRNILMPFDWEQGDFTCRLHDALVAALPDLPELPGKMGFALDTGHTPQLHDGSADFRIEKTQAGLILRADGNRAGWPLENDVQQVIDAIQAMAQWFVDTGGHHAGRMARHLATGVPLPKAWHTKPAADVKSAPLIGVQGHMQVFGIPFGKLETSAFRKVLEKSGARAIRLMTNRRIALMHGKEIGAGPFILDPDHPLLSAHACPGAPFCPQATVQTMQVARDLAPRVRGGLHVSGCSKGCAYAKPTAVTLVGRDGRFDLVQNGTTCDTPRATQISLTDIGAMIETN